MKTDIDAAIARANSALSGLSDEERRQVLARLRMTRVEAAVQNARRALAFLSAADHAVAVERLADSISLSPSQRIEAGGDTRAKQSKAQQS
jgi:hypothetical protein